MFCRQFWDRDKTKIVCIILEKRIRRTRYIRKFDPKCEYISTWAAVKIHRNYVARNWEVMKLNSGDFRWNVLATLPFVICNLAPCLSVAGPSAKLSLAVHLGQTSTDCNPCNPQLHGLLARQHWDGLGCTWSTLKVIVLRFSTFFPGRFENWGLERRGY